MKTVESCVVECSDVRASVRYCCCNNPSYLVSDPSLAVYLLTTQGNRGRWESSPGIAGPDSLTQALAAGVQSHPRAIGPGFAPRRAESMMMTPVSLPPGLRILTGTLEPQAHCRRFLQ